MERQLLLTLTSLAQWGIFLSIIIIIYSYIEKKPEINKVGQLLFVVLGLYSIWIIFSDKLIVTKIIEDDIPIELKVKTFFVGTATAGFMALVSFILNVKNKTRANKIANIILVIFGLLLFFFVHNIQKIKIK